MQIGQVADGQVDPVEGPAAEVVAAGAGTDMREMHDGVEAFVDTIEVALIAPHLEGFTGDAFVKGCEGGNHIQLRAV